MTMTALSYGRLHAGLIGILCLAGAATAAFADGDRVVSLGGSVTEIAVALGAEGRLVARDTTSNFPASVEALPDVGYIRALSPEGVLALDPDLILAEGDAGPPEAVEVLKSAGIPFHLVPEATTPEGLVDKIHAVAQVLGLGPQGKALADQVAAGLAEARAKAAALPETDRKRVLFVLSLQGGRILAGGEGTEAEGIITLAGGVNAGTGFQGYKQMTDEAVIAAAPDVILMMDREGDLAIADADLFGHPAIAQTPAGAAQRVVRMDGMLMLGFGPRTPQAAATLYDAFYPAGG
ncbi:heme/hemin ABC transporter substrate-binding protein [Xinfangfangia pollutisoli]|uniref:heme/hemin ABC transporter substrate-binding protein n=1 Tax=Xinfangfangia pollutisoli TaxID=2865960 RepID=UPI00384D75B2